MEFFETVAGWWGPPRIQPSDRERVSILTQVAGPAPRRILELGAGGGTTAVVAGLAGYDVTAVELAPARAQFSRDLARQNDASTVRVVEGDFYEVRVGGPFDCVMYWNGFGIGNDADQRRLLRRVHDEWLNPGGTLLLDVFSPIPWAARAGTREKRKAAIELVNAHDFDPSTSRFIDTWWPAGDEKAAVTQSARCYALADLALLLEGTGLDLRWAAVKGDLIDLSKPANARHPLWESAFYTCALVRDDE